MRKNFQSFGLEDFEGFYYVTFDENVIFELSRRLGWFVAFRTKTTDLIRINFASNRDFSARQPSFA